VEGNKKMEKKMSETEKNVKRKCRVRYSGEQYMSCCEASIFFGVEREKNNL
jgi:hypothetical protein